MPKRIIQARVRAVNETIRKREANQAALASAGTGVVVLAGGTAAGMLFESVGTAMCLAAPFFSGFAASFVRNEWSEAPARLRDSVTSALLGVGLVTVALVTMTPSGPFYALIAAPPVAVLAVLGALMGHSTVRGRPSMSPVVALLMCWPLLAAAELQDLRNTPREVLSIIDVDRSAEELSPAALASDLAEPPEWQFIAGIARPDPGRRLRIQELSGGRTRLEARTVYTPEMYPSRYWSLWSDKVIHHLQMRALGQIKREAECTARSN
jgi:hypothetical protein